MFRKAWAKPFLIRSPPCSNDIPTSMVICWSTDSPIEGASFTYAALRATTKTAISSAHAMKLYWRRMAVELADEGAADASFHLAIAQSSHVVLYHTTKGLFDLLRRNVITNIGGLYLRGDTRDRILEQHTAIYNDYGKQTR